MAQNKRVTSRRMQRQTQPGVTICISLYQAADWAQLIKGAGKAQGPHLAHRLVELVHATPAHLATKNVPESRAREAKSNLSVRFNFNNGNSCQMRANGAGIEIFALWQAQSVTTRFPMLQEIDLRRREAGEFC